MGNSQVITSLPTLPSEIIEWIFVFCDSKTLAVSIPRASKLFKKLSEDNSIVWKAKCEQKCLDLNSKPSDQTWKQYYFPGTLKLFPFHGFTVTKTKPAEILAKPGAVGKKSGNTEYIEYETNNFWIIEGVFQMLYLVTGDKLPDEWTRQGLTWQISWLELKELLKTKVGNYHVTVQPNQYEFSGQLCFCASITSAMKEGYGENAIYYRLSCDFNYTPGTSDTAGTLYKIVIQSMGTANQFKQIYDEHQCKD